MADVLLLCTFFQWPPPESFYLKTLTNSNYVGPPPLIRCFPFFTSHLWFLGRSASSCTQLPPRLLFLAPDPKSPPARLRPPQKEEGHQKAFAGLCRREHLWSFLVSQSASGVGRWWKPQDPLWLFVCKTHQKRRRRALSFSNIKSPQG